jgi:hypothetical protein
MPVVRVHTWLESVVDGKELHLMWAKEVLC